MITLARTVYAGFNDQHLTELLAEEQAIFLSRPTVRAMLHAAGISRPRRRRPPKHRRQRPRMPQPGLLVQMDGSQHDWLEGRGPRLVLHGAIDDATNQVPAACFRLQEDAAGYLWVLRELARRVGLPVAVYSDRHGIFDRPRRNPTLDEQLQGRPPHTQVGRALEALGIRWIPAASPQAKGRIERLWGTLQDRLVSELRRAAITSREEANRVLAAFLPRYNRRFAVPPAHAEAAYRALPAGLALDHICCFTYARTVANDNTVRLEEHLLQLLPGPGGRSYAKARVEIHEHLDGTLSVSYQGAILRTRILTGASLVQPLRARHHRAPPAPRVISAQPRKPRARQDRPTSKAQPWKPAPDHPWKRAAKEGLRRKELRKAEVTFSLNR